MIQWEKLARDRGFIKPDPEHIAVPDTGDPKAMLTSLYEQFKSIDGIAEELCLSRHTVRVAFERFGVEVQKQGGARHTKLEVTDELLDEIEAHGPVSVARRLNLDYTTVRKRTKEALKKRQALRAAEQQSEPESQDEKGTPHRDESQ